MAHTEPSLACEPLTNAAALAGKIALIERGTCNFVDKIRRAQVRVRSPRGLARPHP